MDFVKACKTLGDENRLKMIDLLLNRTYCSRALSRKLNISEPAVSQHMKVLKEAGLVRSEKYGRHMHYLVNREALKEMAEYLEKLTGRAPGICTRADGGCDLAEYDYCQKMQEQ